MRKKNITKSPSKMIILTIIFVIVASFLILVNTGKTKSETEEQTKKMQIEIDKEGDESCSMVICKGYVGFRYDKVKGKCYCYDAEGVSVERTAPEGNSIAIETTKNTSVNNVSQDV